MKKRISIDGDSRNQAPPFAPSAAFISDTQSGTVPLIVRFTDQSTGTAPLTYAWDFNNDGTVDSIVRNPPYTYTTAGTFTVNLSVTNIAGSDSELKTPQNPTYRYAHEGLILHR